MNDRRIHLLLAALALLLGLGAAVARVPRPEHPVARHAAPFKPAPGC